jgi:Zn-dependent protease with chaperone function
MRRSNLEHPVALVGFGLGLLAAGTVGAALVGLGCDENLHAETARADACTAIGELGGPRWWLLACAPAVVFLVGALTSRRRDRVAGLAGVIFAGLVALDALLIAIVTSNFLA